MLGAHLVLITQCFEILHPYQARVGIREKLANIATNQLLLGQPEQFQKAWVGKGIAPVQILQGHHDRAVPEPSDGSLERHLSSSSAGRCFFHGEKIYENTFQKNFPNPTCLGILTLRLIDQRLKPPLHQESVMKYQEQFLTIWDTPAKASAPQPKAAPQAARTPLKEMFFTIWDSAKNKTASPQ